MREPSSFLMVATAATHGVYKRVNTRKLTAESPVNRLGRTEPSCAVPVFIRTDSVLTTASFAVKPDISAVTARQSPKPSGLNIGAINLPIMASRLSALSSTTLSLVSNDCKNQIIIVAINITVNALCRKSRAFPKAVKRRFSAMAYGNSGAPLQTVRVRRGRPSFLISAQQLCREVYPWHKVLS